MITKSRIEEVFETAVAVGAGIKALVTAFQVYREWRKMKKQRQVAVDELIENVEPKTVAV